MARLARVVVPGYPHHITQRGNRRLPTFFSDADYEAYLDLLAEQCAAHAVRLWDWCLMPNHVHLVAVPKTAEGLARAIHRSAVGRRAVPGASGEAPRATRASRPPRPPAKETGKIVLRPRNFPGIFQEAIRALAEHIR